MVIGEASSMEKDLAYLVPQGSVAGPVLYNCYASTISEVVKPPLQLHGFADDHRVKKSFKPGTQEERLVISNLKNCTGEIKLWMDENRLHMNSSKTELLLVGSRQQLSRCTTESIQVNGETVICNKSIKYLGALADDRLNFKDFVNVKCKMALWNLQKLKNLCAFLTQEASTVLVMGLVMSHIDYTDSILAGLPKVNLKKLQRVQIMAAKLILQRNKYPSAT